MANLQRDPKAKPQPFTAEDFLPMSGKPDTGDDGSLAARLKMLRGRQKE